MKKIKPRDSLKNDLVLRALQVQAKFDIPKYIYALMFKHSEGWTFLHFEKSVDDAQNYIRESRFRKAFDFKIVPCSITHRMKP